MNAFIRRYMRDFILATITVAGLLVIQSVVESTNPTSAVLDAYDHGVTIGTIENQISGEPVEVQLQLVELCEKHWPATPEATISRRRACSGMLVGGVE